MNFLDFFAGIGGFRLGLERAGHSCVGFIEKNNFAVKSYKAMYNTEKEFYSDDITKLQAGELPRASIWCAGFPCSDVAVCGRQLGLAGERSGLFFEFARLLSESEEKNKPRWIIIENVKNLRSIRRGFDFLRIFNSLGDIGYSLEWAICRSQDFGVPQSRERIFIVGFLGERCGREIFPLGRKNTANLKQVGNAIINSNSPNSQRGRIYDPEGLSPTLVTGTPPKVLIDLSVNNPRITDTVRCLTTRYNNGISRRQGEKSGVLLKNGKSYRIRKLTPKETWRLQGFPDELFEKARAVNSDTQLYNQSGNAITANIAEAIGRKISEYEAQESQESQEPREP